MNKLITGILLSISSLTLAQTRRSCFEWTGGNQTDWFCFQDSRFKHINKTHEFYSYGEGRIIESSDSLKFQYSDYKSDFKILEAEIGSNDSIQISVKIIEIESTSPVENSTVYIDRIGIGDVSDQMGDVEIILSKNNILTSDEMRIRTLGYPDKYISLQELKIYRAVRIEVWVSDRISFYSDKDYDPFKNLIYQNRDLRFQNEYGYVYTFKKISSKRFDKIFDDLKLTKFD